MVMDSIISEVKADIDGLTGIVVYADDIVAFGRFSLKKMKEILAKYGLVVNDRKSVSFKRWLKGVPKRRNFKYLGHIINDKGEPKWKTKIIKSLKEKAKSIGKIYQKNRKTR